MTDDKKFNPLEQMMEFGMSIAVAQQMVQVMNHAMNNSQTPQFKNLNSPIPVPIRFYAIVNEVPQGPFNESEFTNHIIEGRINKKTLVWINGLPSWVPAEQVLEVNKLFPPLPPLIK